MALDKLIESMRAQASAELPSAAPVTAMPPMPPAPDEEPAEPEEAAAAGKYKVGDKVKTKGGAVGTVSGEGAPGVCYPVTMEDGSESKVCESDLEPAGDAAPVEKPIDAPLNEVPAALVEALGLPAGSSLDTCVAAAAQNKADAGEAVSMAMAAAGVPGDLVPTVAATLGRKQGETIGAAVDRDKSARPSAYRQVQANAATPPPAAAQVIDKPLEMTAAPLAVGATMGRPGPTPPKPLSQREMQEKVAAARQANQKR